MNDNPSKHWADEAAERLLARGPKHVINTGITPSGPIHVGNSREILTADAVHRAVLDQGGECVLNYIADSYDPLRRVYPFLDETVYGQHVGKPLSHIPCPCGGHESYADHFLEPFLDGARRLGVDLHLLKAHELYESGEYDEAIFDALEGRDAIAGILKELTGKETAADWSPFNPLCPECGRLGTSRVEGFDREQGTISVTCGCGWSGQVVPAGGGKLTWRVDWPARWRILGCTFEPFGKDHATRGGSYDTGVRIAKEVFGYEPPDYVLYEWISLKGRGDMSSSKGNVLSIGDMLEVSPPEVFRFLLMDRQPQRAIELDPGKGVVSLIGEYDRRCRETPEDRALVLSKVDECPPCPVPFPHLVTTVQIADATLAGKYAGEGREATVEEWGHQVLEILERSGYPLPDEAVQHAVLNRAVYAATWLERFGPEDMKFTLAETLPPAVEELGSEERAFLADLAEALKPTMGGQAVHDAIHELKDKHGLKPAAAFRAVYRAFLGTDRGPRAGAFLASLDTEWAVERLRRAGGTA